MGLPGVKVIDVSLEDTTDSGLIHNNGGYEVNSRNKTGPPLENYLTDLLGVKADIAVRRNLRKRIGQRILDEVVGLLRRPGQDQGISVSNICLDYEEKKAVGFMWRHRCILTDETECKDPLN